MTVYRKYSAIGERLANGRPLPRPPRIGVYAGAGSSHSWLWFVELFDRTGLNNVVFLDESDVRGRGLEGVDVLAIAGGDTFAVAEAFGEKGAERIGAFVERGGLYIGSCAGAYLPMNSSKPHLNRFNFVDVKIANLSRTMPEAERMAYKFCTAYGCGFIFHPVREAVTVKLTGEPPFTGFRTVSAPLYGGPAMIPSERSHVLALYDGFTEKTAFLVNRSLARDTLAGRAAAIRHPYGTGWFYLLGPHFEHPGYPEANELILQSIFYDMPATSPLPKDDADSESGRRISAREKTDFIRDLKRELSNSRIVAAGMEIMPIRWTIGAKVYEPEKIRVFIESMWRRIRFFEKAGEIVLPDGPDERMAERMIGRAVSTTTLLRAMKQEIDGNGDTLTMATDAFELLHQLSTDFFDAYFRTKMGLQAQHSL